MLVIIRQTSCDIIRVKANSKAAGSTATHSFWDLGHSCVLTESMFSIVVELGWHNSTLLMLMLTLVEQLL